MGLIDKPCCEGLVCEPYGELMIGVCRKEDSGNIQCTLCNILKQKTVHSLLIIMIMKLDFPLFSAQNRLLAVSDGAMEQ